MALTNSTQTPIGWQAADFQLTGIDDQPYNLDHFFNHQGLLIIFTCNHCPYAKAAWPILQELHQQFQDSISFVAINSNDVSTHPEDSFENMKKYASELSLDFAYLYDETQAVAREYGAVCTPDNFLFRKTDHHFELYYRGRINDNWQNPDAVTSHNLRNALSSLTQGNPPPDNQPPSMGCSIKWKSAQ